MRLNNEAKKINEAILVMQRLLMTAEVSNNELVSTELSKVELSFHRKLHEIQNRPKKTKAKKGPTELSNTDE